MTAKNQTVRMTAGDSRMVRVVCAKPDGSPVILGSGLPVMTVAPSLNAPASEVILVKNGSWDTVTVSGQTFYRANFVIEPTDTRDVEPQNYMHQCEVRMSATQIHTFAEGPFIVDPSMPHEVS